jgi:hypothetical protein
VREPTGELADHLKVPFSTEADLPQDATDTGWHHDGRELWLVPGRSAAYLVSLEDETDVERWAAGTQHRLRLNHQLCTPSQKANPDSRWASCASIWAICSSRSPPSR